ncbi:MAG: 4-(cytidine 5'-diphospho)-2-C-methyl-D-erythritol kinase [Nitritalea sp.]
MLAFPNAKINLGLSITAKRPDGYHEIETCMVPIALQDALEIIESKQQRFFAHGIPIPGEEKDNLILKAYRLLKKDFPSLPEVEIHLLKKIPMGAGLGGGSADAAFALTLMSKLFNLHLEDFLLEEYAAKLGSDCPFFVQNTPKIATGRGEILNPIQLPPQEGHLVLVYPQVHVSTREAYAGIRPKKPACVLREVLAKPECWKEQLINDFEQGIFALHPELAHIKESLYQAGAWYAAMSGSGSTLFGIFKHSPPPMDWPTQYQVFTLPWKW